ncbi:oligosaccharide flippase family protein [Elizabethkingia argentiflava]|uniref:Oligosaccharide flippase family protein n=1 Tax=Elizabethkingia argenteiflava TaxID=2681556 RepID=A0A845PXY4_9FLAO|nr:lipopolysaccharide biosynthesis protein [Elizabethkingia argenteiflava]NAW51327.1 oligosaccharide flippase family protein [Elizabethkingia argenteiflava]
MELKKQAVRSTLWAVADQFSSQIVAFGVNLMLARLLLPEDFGTIALFNVVMSVSSVLINGGLASSLIRTPQLDNRDLSTVFWFNVIMSSIIYGVIFMLTPLIADFYHKPILENLIRVYAVILIIDSFVTVQSVRFEKELNFRTTFLIKMPSILMGGISGILFAWLGFGVWSLVYSALIKNVVSTLQYWFYSKWRPSFIFDKLKFKKHFGFGIRMTLSSLLNVVSDNLYPIIIGKKFSSTELGYYDRADALKQFPINNISSILNRVSFPLFAKISHDDQRLKSSYQEILRLAIFGIAPLAGIMILEAKPLIRFLFTEKWLPIVPYFQILSLAGVLYPIHAYNLNILQVKGRSDLFLKLEIIKKLIIVLVVIIAIPFGMYGLVWGQVVISVISLFINTFYTGKFLNYNLFQQLKEIFPSVFIAFVTSLMMWVLDKKVLYAQQDIIRLMVIGVLFLSVYLGITYLLKFRELSLIKNLISKK